MASLTSCDNSSTTATATATLSPIHHPSHNIDICRLNVTSLIDVFWNHGPLVRDQIDRSFTTFIQMIQLSKTLGTNLDILQFKLAVIEDSYQREAHFVCEQPCETDNNNDDDAKDDDGIEDEDVDHIREVLREKEPIIQEMDTTRKNLSQVLGAIDRALNTSALFCSICRSSLHEQQQPSVVLPSSEQNMSLFDLYCSEEDTPSPLATEDHRVDDTDTVDDNGDSEKNSHVQQHKRTKRSRRV